MALTTKGREQGLRNRDSEPAPQSAIVPQSLSPLVPSVPQSLIPFRTISLHYEVKPNALWKTL